jgi:hypothetical protein
MKLKIYKNIRDPDNPSKIVKQETLRIINVSNAFLGIGEGGSVNRAEFEKLANVLEPYNDGIVIS